MIVGAFALGRCYDSVQTASQAVCTGSYPLVGAGTGGPYVVTCSGADPSGVLSLAVDGQPLQSSPLTFASCEAGDEFLQLGFTPSEILSVAGWGLGFVVFLWSLGYVVGVGVNLVRRV